MLILKERWVIIGKNEGIRSVQIQTHVTCFSTMPLMSKVYKSRMVMQGGVYTPKISLFPHLNTKNDSNKIHF